LVDGIDDGQRIDAEEHVTQNSQRNRADTAAGNHDMLHRRVDLHAASTIGQ
jgi:hypothetical protein